MSTGNSSQLPSNVKDETGNPYGKLTVLGYAGSKLKALPGAYWHCRCECGAETVVAGRALRNKTIQSCGCSRQRTNEVGSVYNKLTVLEFAGNTKGGDSRWLCRCECGNTTTASRGDLRKESIKSCGCHRAKARGMCKSTEYTSWKEMKRRCYNPNYPDYDLYGGKGITVCQHWLDAFVNFFDDMGPKPFPEATVDRISGEGNYEKNNCRWATKKEQSHNTSKTRMLTYNGETYCLREWARRLGISHCTLRTRLAKGWPLEKVFSSEHFLVPPPKKKPKTQ